MFFFSKMQKLLVLCLAVAILFDTGFLTTLTRRVPLVEQELFTLPEHLSSFPVFSGFRVTRYLVLCVCFAYRRLCPSQFVLFRQ
jgi:hypothetical protein